MGINMSTLLELREKLKVIYSRNDVYIIPVMKFLLAFFVLNFINGNLGYMSKLDDLPVVLIVALLCSFLPNGCIVFFGALFSILHMYALSMEVALVGLCLYLVISLLFFRFSPRDSLVVLLTPMAFSLGIPYVVPMVMGLLGTPASAVSVGCGIVIYYFLSNVTANAQIISAMEAEEAVAKLQLVLNALINNRAMLVIIVAFAVTIVIVYLVRRLPVDHSWTIAILSGSIVDVILLLVGDLMYDTNVSMVSAIIGTLIAILVAKVVEFFKFCVDYNRTENVQFEDDEYYYYVRAIPKMTVATQSKKVKRINAQRRPSGSRSRRAAETSRQADYRREREKNTRYDMGDEVRAEELYDDVGVDDVEEAPLLDESADSEEYMEYDEFAESNGAAEDEVSREEDDFVDYEEPAEEDPSGYGEESEEGSDSYREKGYEDL